MKPFNLEEALKGAPVRLRNGAKAYIFANIKDLFPSTEIERPLIGIHSYHGDYSYYSDNESWTLEGRYYPDSDDCDSNSFDIISMWEEPELTQEQILEKAYNQGLKVKFLGSSYSEYDVVGKLKSGGYVLQHGIALMKSTEVNGIELYQEKPSTVTVTLPRPVIPKEDDKVFFLQTDGDGELYVNYCEKVENPDYYKDGNCFKTKEDAQAWIDAMKGALDE